MLDKLIAVEKQENATHPFFSSSLPFHLSSAILPICLLRPLSLPVTSSLYCFFFPPSSLSSATFFIFLSISVLHDAIVWFHSLSSGPCVLSFQQISPNSCSFSLFNLILQMSLYPPCDYFVNTFYQLLLTREASVRCKVHFRLFHTEFIWNKKFQSWTFCPASNSQHKNNLNTKDSGGHNQSKEEPDHQVLYSSTILK